ncbi:LbetaH domain-containing protein [Litchfieldia salsa]|uniref:Carbon dioxide concentrating mechanism protein CcmM n=1 Tax=Litchfieldia salsa TaxID=930152 RepID=A0A1H0WYD8_9BACI|nr:carbonate dehydratase [Litchfieldia salsa]SDP95754.1 carbon dioxide concentrating mechanism protein CcmM [Litchfieldia salsa]
MKGQYIPYNAYTYYIGANPYTSFNQAIMFPRISKTATLSPFCLVIGNVTVYSNVYIGPFVSIRADEGSPFRIGKNTNLQDGVTLHGLKNKQIEIHQKKYSIYIGEEVSCTHGSLIHGPCFIGDRVFVGFNSIIFDAIVGEGSYISAYSSVSNGVTIEPYSFVPPGAHIDTQDKADSLKRVPVDKHQFAKEVQRVNQEFPVAYSMFFGNKRCTCGVTYSDN